MGIDTETTVRPNHLLASVPGKTGEVCRAPELCTLISFPSTLPNASVAEGASLTGKTGWCCYGHCWNVAERGQGQGPGGETLWRCKGDCACLMSSNLFHKLSEIF